MILELPTGAKEIQVPEIYKRSIPNKYKIEALINADGLECLAIIKIKSIASPIINSDLLLNDEDFKIKVVNPMIEALEKRF